jgi:hypothetical protein
VWGRQHTFLSPPASDSLAYASPDLGHHARVAHESTPHSLGTLTPDEAAGIGLGGHVGAVAVVGSTGQMPLSCPDGWSPALIRFKFSWEAFIDLLLREWKTLNLVLALLTSCVALLFW